MPAALAELFSLQSCRVELTVRILKDRLARGRFRLTPAQVAESERARRHPGVPGRHFCGAQESTARILENRLARGRVWLPRAHVAGSERVRRRSEIPGRHFCGAHGADIGLGGISLDCVVQSHECKIITGENLKVPERHFAEYNQARHLPSANLNPFVHLGSVSSSRSALLSSGSRRAWCSTRDELSFAIMTVTSFA